MSTTDTEQAVNHSPLLDLPRQLRDLIYEQVFADLISNPLYIRRFCFDRQWKVCCDSQARVPGLLLTSKAIYSESKSCLYTSCNSPRIVIDDQRSVVDPGTVKKPEEVGKHFGFAVRDLETIVPILTTVEELTFDIEALDETPGCLSLVRWIRAVLNARERQLRRASVRLRAGVVNHLPPHIGNPMKEVCKETARIMARNRLVEEIWLLKRTRVDTLVGPSFGIAWKGRHTVQEELPDALPCDVAWRDLMQCSPGGPVGF
jgi:hypothetical protein